MKENPIVTIIHNKIETPIKITSANPIVLIIENTSEFFALVSELKSQFAGEDGNFILLKEDNRISFEKFGDIVSDVFDIDFVSKKIISSLYKKLDNLSKEDTLRLHLNKVNTCLAEFYNDLFDKIDLSLTFDEVETSDLLKTANVSLQVIYDSCLEKIVCYINAMTQLKSIEFFVFVHLKSILSDNELDLLYKHCEREKVGLILIESCANRKKLSNEVAIIITSDLCEIVDNNTV
ncbi:MAG: type II-A CRISPR-associated protein Csn2 [Clostridia bacterium]|nr:type II-A CRISPR-associated protein Csn2 [Clostridia bacterium]